MAQAGKGMGGGVAGNRAGPKGRQTTGRTVPRVKPVEGDNTEISEATLSQEKMGDFKQQGFAEELLTNQRETQPDARHEADDIVESFEKLDKDVRAERDLGKGRRGGSHGR